MNRRLNRKHILATVALIALVVICLLGIVTILSQIVREYAYFVGVGALIILVLFAEMISARM